MTLDGRTYVSIFTRTFAQLAVAVLLAVQGLDLVSEDGLRVNGTTAGLGMLLALIGAVVATLWAYAGTPAATPLQKALRSAAQAIAGGLGAVVLNESADLFDLPKVLLSIAVATVFAFLITYLQNMGPVPVVITPPNP